MFIHTTHSGLIIGLRPANERRRYKVTPSLIDWAQTWNQPCPLVKNCAIIYATMRIDSVSEKQPWRMGINQKNMGEEIVRIYWKS